MFGITEAALLGVLVYFVIGIAAGAIVKHSFKWFLALIIVVVMFIVLGYVNVGSLKVLSEVFIPELKTAMGDVGIFIGSVQVSIGALGFAIGLWRG